MAVNAVNQLFTLSGTHSRFNVVEWRSMSALSRRTGQVPLCGTQGDSFIQRHGFTIGVLLNFSTFPAYGVILVVPIRKEGPVMERNTVLQPFLSHLATDRQICNQLLGNISAGKSSKTIKLAVVNFWRNNLQRHIEAEEKTLLPFLVRHHFNPQYTNLLHREHDTIRVLAERLSGSEEGDYLYEAFVKLVHEHLLFEDKVIFTRIQETIPSPELEQLKWVA